MELKQIRYFKTIVDEGTISKAAATLHMAQPPLSMQLKTLEQELDCELLIRGRRKVTLTPA
ncbi:MAG: LysR family transcriptional regulator, partial [bacterium]